VKEYGQPVLASPEDTGFNRLAWLLPYMLAGGGLITIIWNARRWSHRPAAAASGVTASSDAALDARLDDELRSLD
jgi:cytochrome c-type biogenesis protein CcmH/NrfF